MDTYSNPRTTQCDLQFQVFNGRQYQPICNAKDEDTLRHALGDARKAGTPWRIAKLDRALKPKYIKPQPNSVHPVEHVQRAYLEWAKAKGITQISVYDKDCVRQWFRASPFTIRPINPNDQFLVTEETI